MYTLWKQLDGVDARATGSASTAATALPATVSALATESTDKTGRTVQLRFLICHVVRVQTV